MDAISDDLVLLHHVTRIGHIVKKKATKKNEKIVVLHGFGASTIPIRFKSYSYLFDKRFIVTTSAPFNFDFEIFENVSSFKSLSLDKENIKLFLKFVTLPPFAVIATLSAESRQPASSICCCCVPQRQIVTIR